MLEWLDKNYGNTIEIMTLESPKYIIIRNKYKQCAPLGSSKKIKWGLLKIVTILNTKGVYSNLTEQYWHKKRVMTVRWSETLMKTTKILLEKEKRESTADT